MSGATPAPPAVGTPPTPPPAGTPVAVPPPISMPPLSRQLAKAAEWILASGRVVNPALAMGPLGPFQVLVVQQAPGVPVLLTEQGRYLLVSGQVQINPQDRARLQSLPAEVRREGHELLLAQLLASERTGFGVMPPNAASVDQVDAFVVQQVIFFVPEGHEPDTAGVNRLLDAIQEVASAGIRGKRIIDLLLRQPGGVSGTTTPTAPPPPQTLPGYG